MKHPSISRVLSKRISIQTLLLSTLFLPLTFAAPVNYSYDSAGRLTKVDYGTNGSTVYTYDKAGNLTGRTVIGAGAGGVITSVNTAGSPASAGIAQNGWIEIHGSNLVPTTTPAAGVIWSNAPEFAQGKMPTQLGGISVTVNGKPAYVYYFCSSATNPGCATDQVNALTPLDSTTGSVQIVVTNGTTASAPFPATMNSVVPSLLLFVPQGYVAATHADYSLIGPPTLYPGASTPAIPGETVLVYAVGFGLPSTALTAGSSTQTGSLGTLPACKIGGNAAAVGFAGLISPGLYQLNLVVPANAPDADNSISCAYSGATTPAGNLLTVHQ
jgi:uncharacterized protein (TIGR03437 family)